MGRKSVILCSGFSGPYGFYDRGFQRLGMVGSVPVYSVHGGGVYAPTVECLLSPFNSLATTL